MTEYPEHEKLKEVQEKSQSIGEFLEWILHSKKVHSERFRHDALEIESPVVLAIYRPVLDSDPRLIEYSFGGIEKLLSEYFEIDLVKIEAEKRQMLDEMRAMNKK